MTSRDLFQLGLLLVVIYGLGDALAAFLIQVFSGKPHFLSKPLGGFERFAYRICAVDPTEESDWKGYSVHLLLFCFVSSLVTYLLLRLQAHLPLNPQSLGPPSPDLALSATVGFNTNASWQSYAGEAAMSYFSQTVPLLLQFFVSPAVGIVAAVAIVRGLVRTESSRIGNFWADLIRCALYVLLPLGFAFAIFLVSQGVVQNFRPYSVAETIEGGKQLIAQGPAAAQVAMKLLGTNGGGFFNANSAHPYENPNALTNFLQIVMMLLLPSAFPFYLGRATGNRRHGRAVWLTMALLFVVATLACAHYEAAGNPLLEKLGASSAANFEGKEARFGIFGSALFASVTTATGTGAVNSVLDSFAPLGGLVPLANILTSEVIFGGVGSGLYGMVLFVFLTFFLTGLMVGRTPEYLGKKIQAREIKYASLAMIAPVFLVLAFAAAGVLAQAALAGLGNPGSHGFSELFYDYASAVMNNGSTFAGLNTNTPYWNYSLAVALFVGRYFTMIPMLALAGSMAGKRRRHVERDPFPAHGLLFIGVLTGVIVLVGVLTFLPAIVLGPVAEHLLMVR